MAPPWRRDTPLDPCTYPLWRRPDLPVPYGSQPGSSWVRWIFNSLGISTAPPRRRPSKFSTRLSKRHCFRRTAPLSFCIELPQQLQHTGPGITTLPRFVSSLPRIVAALSTRRHLNPVSHPSHGLPLEAGETKLFPVRSRASGKGQELGKTDTSHSLAVHGAGAVPPCGYFLYQPWRTEADLRGPRRPLRHLELSDLALRSGSPTAPWPTSLRT